MFIFLLKSPLSRGSEWASRRQQVTYLCANRRGVFGPSLSELRPNKFSWSRILGAVVAVENAGVLGINICSHVHHCGGRKVIETKDSAVKRNN